jgi:hypothetical protein
VTFLEPDKQTKRERQAMATKLGLPRDFFLKESETKPKVQP